MVDSAKNGKGRFRPYIFTMAIPTVILALGFTWMPYDKMTLFWKCFTVLIFNIGFQFFYTFMFDSYTNIINVLSPNTYERSDVCSVTAVTDSLAPTIIGFIMPLLARAITGENTIYDMKIYRIVFPPILLVGLLLTILIHVNTEEKVIEAKTHVIKIGFMDALRAVAKNKYFWIISCASWIGFLESSFGTILAWLYNYQDACTPLQYSIVTAVYGNSALWSMLFAPVLIRKIGKRNLLLYSNLMSIFFILCMYPVVTEAPKSMIIWLMLGCMFINGLGTSLGNLLQYSLNGDIRDYQQYLTGERIDGMFFTIGLIGSVVGMVTGSVLPAIYNWAGLNETVAKSLGYDGSNVYYVLYDPDYFKRICGILVIASAIGAALNAIPYFFYDLTEVKQKAMVRVLKIRALFEDYGNNALSDENLIEAIDLIDEAYEYYDKEAVKPDKLEIKAAKKLNDKSAVKEAKAKYKEQKEINEKIVIGKFIVKEVEKFDSPAMKIQLERADKIVASGLDGLKDLNTVTVKQARKLPKATADEKEIRKYAIENARAEKASKKALEKNYSNGITEFDSDIFGELFRQEDALDLEIKALIDDYRKAREKKDKSKANEINAEIKALRKKKYAVQKKIKEFTAQYSVYNRAAKPYIDAKKLLIQQENYRRYDEIKANYEDSKLRAEAQRAEREEAEKREKAEKEAYAEQLKAERKTAKQRKTNKK
ncbi:MAG: MFS transporter [Eubacterium sp.]